MTDDTWTDVCDAGILPGPTTDPRGDMWGQGVPADKQETVTDIKVAGRWL